MGLFALRVMHLKSPELQREDSTEVSGSIILGLQTSLLAVLRWSCLAMMINIINRSRRFLTVGLKADLKTYCFATSNWRYLMPRDMIENERSSSINWRQLNRCVPLDRFGLWLGFHPRMQDEYLEMINGYCSLWMAPDPIILRAEAIEWQATRGARSGRRGSSLSIWLGVLAALEHITSVVHFFLTKEGVLPLDMKER